MFTGETFDAVETQVSICAKGQVTARVFDLIFRLVMIKCFYLVRSPVKDQIKRQIFARIVDAA